MISKATRRRITALLGGLFALLLVGTALAQNGGDVYRLPAGEVIDDDLYIGAGEVYIAGTVRGDVIASGGYVEISGIVEGDVNAAAAGVVISGQVTDDVRVAGAGVQISGQIGDDLYAAAGGGPGSTFIPDTGAPSVAPGVAIDAQTTIGGNAGLFGGEVRLNGNVDGDLTIGAAVARLNGVVAKNAEIDAGDFVLGPNARVNGQLNYTTGSEITIPPVVSDKVTFTQSTSAPTTPPLVAFGWRLWRIALTLTGIVLLGLLLFRFSPPAITKPADAISDRPGRVTIYGLAAALVLIFLPLLSALLVFAMVLFWGWFPGVALLFFLFAGLTTIWYLSPLISGLWLGRLILHQFGREAPPIGALALGAAIILLIGLIPILGWMTALASFILALGGLILGFRKLDEEQPMRIDRPAMNPM